MFPDHFYLTGAGWFGYLFYIPVALLVTGLTYWLLLRRIRRGILRHGSLIAISLTLLTLPLWEATFISFTAAKLCTGQGGLHVYKTVNTEGFLGGWGIERAAENGFSFVESGAGENMNRWTVKDGVVHRERISEYKSRYQVQVNVDSSRIGEHFKRNSSRVIDRENSEVLGELVTIGIYPSRFDLFVLDLLPVEYSGWRCGDEVPEGKGEFSPAHGKRLYGISDVIKTTLKPISQEQ